MIGTSISLGNEPARIGITPNGAMAYVVNICGSGSCDPVARGTISIIDTTTNAVTATLTVDYRPYGIAMSPDGGSVYVADQCGEDQPCSALSGAVTVIDTGPMLLFGLSTQGRQTRSSLSW